MASSAQTSVEKYIGGAIAFNFENHWQSVSRTTHDAYDPSYPQALVTFFLTPLKNQMDNPKMRIPPPHLSAFARTIGSSVRRMESWAELFPEFNEAMQIARDVHCEMLINGALVGNYSDRMSQLLLSHFHGIKDKKEQEVPNGAVYSPMTAGQAVNYLLEQQGVKPIELKAEDAEFRETNEKRDEGKA